MSQNIFLNKKIVSCAIIFFCVLSDQLSKWYILEKILKPAIPNSNYESLRFAEWWAADIRLPFVSIDVLPFFNFTMVWNEGISFGLMHNSNPWPLIVISAIIIIFFIVWILRSHNWMEILPLSMVIGGAIGNIKDRLHFGAVADFLDFHINDWSYPAFNLADSYITIGIVILVINSLFFVRSK